MTHCADACNMAGCPDSAASRLQDRDLCREHFLSVCYELLDHYERSIREQSFRDAAAESVRTFLLNCTREAIDLAHGPDPLENLQRARLLDILMRAADLARHLRRSPRKEMNVPLRIQCEKLGHAWEVETHTRVISRYGALLAANHEVHTGDLLIVTRLDTQRRTRARVAWAQRRPDGGTDLGLELLNCDDFWGIDWSYADPMLHEPETILKLANDATQALQNRNRDLPRSHSSTPRLP